MDYEGAYPRKKLRDPVKKGSWLVTGFVLAIGLMIIAGLFTPNVCGRCGLSSRVPAAKSDISEISAAIEQFSLDCRRYPTTSEGLEALRVQPDQTHRWNGPYLDKPVFPDPWGNAYQYSSPGPNGHGYLIESYGADGQPGGEGENADIIGGSDD